MAADNQPPDADVSDDLAIDLNDLTFREQLELRKHVKDLIGEEEIFDPPMTAVVPVAYFILKRREDPDFTLDEALEMKWEDVRKRPTKARKTRAAAGGRNTTR